MSESVGDLVRNMDGVYKIAQATPEHPFVVNCSKDSVSTVKNKIEENGFTVTSENLVYDNVNGGSFKRLKGAPSK